MSQNTSVESSTRSSPNQSINPALQAALTSIDVQLEEELARYRRQRAGQAVMSPRGLGRHHIRKPLELISIDKSGGQTQRPALGMSTAAPISFPLFMGNQKPSATPPKETNHEPVAQTGQLDVHSLGYEPGEGLVAPSLTHATVDNSGTKAAVTEQLTPPKGSADVGGDLVPLAAATTPPEDYLESSEQLLRSLSEEEADVQPKKHFTDRLLTPLGVGSILLLLLSSATAAYIITNPSTPTALGFNRLFGSKTPSNPQSSTQTKVAGNSTGNSPTVNGPNLAYEEFPEVNLNTLSHLQASPAPSPSVSPIPPVSELPNAGVTSAPPSIAPNSALPRRSSDLSSALLQSSGQQGTVGSMAAPSVAPLPAPLAAAPRVSNPSSAPAQQKPLPALGKAAANQPSSALSTSVGKKMPQASSSPEQVAASTASTSDDYYFVLLNSGSESALEQARTVVPDAYVRDFPQGTLIQMGAFKRESEAKTLVEELKQQGIFASIYRP